MGQEPDAAVHQKKLISIIVPVLNEEQALPACLQSATGQEHPFELIVVDGGSEDSTVTIARDHGAIVLESPPGRAGQMNRGAERSTGDILVFLHADSRLPSHALAEIRRAVSGGWDGGAFTLQFSPNSPFLSASVLVGDLYCRLTKDLMGDRAIFITREAFKKLDGYREMDLMEDVDLSVRLRNRGFRTGILPGPVITSSRRFIGIGVLPAIWWTARLLYAFHRGHDLDKVAREFYKARKR